MRLLLLTPGTGSFFCGSCLRDNALARGLRALGEDVVLAPLYLPFVLEGEPAARAASTGEAPVHLGGIRVYLLQKLPWLRFLPRALWRWLDRPALLRWASRRAGMTDAGDLGPLTVSMLRGEHGRQASELERLAAWMERERPDAVILSNAMLLGLARRLRARLDVPVLCTLQGEAPFLDGLPEPWRSQAWEELARRASDVDLFLPVSEYTARLMGERLGIEPERLAVVHNGIELEDFAGGGAPRSAAPTLGFLARLCRDKGIDRLVDAFEALARDERFPGLRLVAGGVALAEDEPLLAELGGRLERAGLAERVELRRNLTREQKLALLRSVDVLCVPALYGESFGLYVLEALACGVPVVEPRHGGLTEVVEATGGGLLYDAEVPGALAETLATLLADPDRARELGEAGRERVRRAFTAERMAREVLEQVQRLA